MSNLTGKNRRGFCDLCGAADRQDACEDFRCGWRELPPRSVKNFDGDREAGRAEQAPANAA